MKNILQQTFQDCSAKFIGVPYEEYDCWGIVKFFYKEIMNIDIDIYDNSNNLSNSEINDIVHIEKSNYMKVNDPQFGDIIVFNMFGFASHIGIYLYENRFLHTSKKANSMIELLPKWKNRVEGFYRWQK